MKTEQQIRDKIVEFKNDSRMKQKTATIQINAPLALIQLGFESQISILEWVLEDE